MKKFFSSFRFAVTVIVLFLVCGAFVTFVGSWSSSYLGMAGMYTQLDNTSITDLSSSDVSTIWYLITAGAPSPFVFVGALSTFRIEVTEVEFIGEYCGSVSYRMYTFFNMIFLESSSRVGCA